MMWCEALSAAVTGALGGFVVGVLLSFTLLGAIVSWRCREMTLKQVFDLLDSRGDR